MDITTLYERVISSSNLDEDAKASEMLWLHTPLLTVEVRVRISPEAPNFIDLWWSWCSGSARTAVTR